MNQNQGRIIGGIVALSTFRQSTTFEDCRHCNDFCQVERSSVSYNEHRPARPPTDLPSWLLHGRIVYICTLVGHLHIGMGESQLKKAVYWILNLLNCFFHFSFSINLEHN